MELGLGGKVAIVTGAARGLGKAIALALAAEGTRLALLDIDGAALERTASELTAGNIVTSLCVDVSQEGQVRQAVAQTALAGGRVDILVNNAGVASVAKLPEISSAEWDRVMATNLRGTLLMSQAAYPFMQKQGGGVIINMSSMAAKVGGLKIGPAYAASKAGIICLTIALAKSGAPFGIRANALAPAFIETDMMPADRKDEYAPLIPLGRMGKPDEVAAAVLFLASDKAGFITGEVLDINGGAFMD
jgi:3-oxoacyl-[acyl-carrier protein] reductase